MFFSGHSVQCEDGRRLYFRAYIQLVDVVLSGVVSSVSGLPDCLEFVLQEGLGFTVEDGRVELW